MAGSVAANPHEGSRSEILADYLFSGWGTVTPARRQDDHGIDLFCTLTKRQGKLAIVTNYFSVQVKSQGARWRLQGSDEIKWLIEYPTPLYLARVDKKKLILSIYRTSVRFMVDFWEKPATLTLQHSEADTGAAPKYISPEVFDLSAPIIRAGMPDLLDTERMNHLRKVFEFWIQLDEKMAMLHRIGVLRLRGPDKYTVNELPTNAGFVELGIMTPTKEQIDRAMETLIEVLDCVGDQIRSTDPHGATHAAMLMNHIRTKRDDAIQDLRWHDRASPWSLEQRVSNDVFLRSNPSPAYAMEPFYSFVAKVNSAVEEWLNVPKE